MFLSRKLKSLLGLMTVSLVCLQGLPSFAQNSTRKIRVRPAGLAKKIGSAIEWQPNLEEAFRISKQTGKPIFWYVPTLSNTFMDRKDSIDRYMLAGPFSWPQSIQTLNGNFICVKAAPTPELAKRFQLQPFKFIEPGFLILDSAGQLKTRLDQITTLSPSWFLQRLEPTNKWKSLNEHWERYEAGEWDFSIPENELAGDGEQAIYNRWLQAMLEFRQGKQEEACNRFKALASAYPEHPLAWKAAAEAQGFGPFVRGFETHRKLPESALEMSRVVPGTSVAKSTYSNEEIWRRSTEFLLGMQNSEGGWVDSDYDFGGTDSLPNVHVAVTSLAGMALIEAQKKFPDLKQRIQHALDKATSFVSDEKNLNRRDRDEILWAQAYRTRFLARLNPSDENMAKLQAAVQDLENIQTKRGSWYHEYPNPFVTATALCALKEAKDAGAQVDLEKVKKGIQALQSDRFGNGAFPYSSGRRGGGPGSPRDLAASAGRMPLCQVGLFYWGQADKDAESRLLKAIETSFDLHSNLDSALKYDDHTSNLAYGGFFFWYDMRGRCEAIAQIKDADARTKLFKKQLDLILELAEIDGCFVDSHELGRCYGTSMALLCLKMCE